MDDLYEAMERLAKCWGMSSPTSQETHSAVMDVLGFMPEIAKEIRNKYTSDSIANVPAAKNDGWTHLDLQTGKITTSEEFRSQNLLPDTLDPVEQRKANATLNRVMEMLMPKEPVGAKAQSTKTSEKP